MDLELILKITGFVVTAIAFVFVKRLLFRWRNKQDKLEKMKK